MKKTYLILIGIVAVLSLLAIWVYLLIYGTPKPVESFFTDFSFTGDAPIEPILPPLATQNPTVDVATAQLRQLTTKPVIGFAEIISGSENTVEIYYAEAGTGHIFAINLENGQERRVSNTTIPQADKATFSTDGRYVAVRAGYTIASPITLINLSNPDQITSEVLTARMIDYTFANQNELLYTEYQGNGLVGRSLAPDTGVTRNVFTIPFRSATVIWSTNANTPHYVYPKASAKLAGFLYSLPGGILKRENAAGAGLTAIVNAEYFVTTSNLGQEPGSFATDVTTSERTPLPIIVDPNKCIFARTDSNILYCGSADTEFGSNFPDNWYRGSVTFSDNLYEVNIRKGLSAQLINPETAVGRGIDVLGMSISANSEMLYFTNKNDNTLWMYEI